MNWKEICKIGLEVLASVTAGVIVFIGIEKSVSSSERKKNKNKDAPVQNSKGCIFNPHESKMIEEMDTQDSPVIDAMKGTQSTFGKVFNFIQDLTTATESLSRVFDGGESAARSQQSQSRSSNKINVGDGQTWTRQSPFIINTD